MFSKKPSPPAGAQPTILTLKNEVEGLRNELQTRVAASLALSSQLRELQEEVERLSQMADLQGQQIAALKLDLEELNKRQQSPAPAPPKRPTKKKGEGGDPH